MKKIALVVFFVLFLNVLTINTARAFKKESFLTINVAVEIKDIGKTLKNTDNIIKQATMSASPITFYLDYETVRTATVAAYFKKIAEDYPYHRLGLWTKVTEHLLTDTIPYQGEKSIGSNARTNLTAYAVEDRKKLIDQMMQTYLGLLGSYPDTILDDYVDSSSLQYMLDRYGLIGSVNTYGELGLKLSVSDGKSQPNDLFNRYFPYLPSVKNALYPGTERENTMRMVVSPGFTTVMNRLAADQLPQITDKLLSEFTYLGVVSPISADSHLEVKEWISTYKDFADKYSLRLLDQDSFADLVLARYPYHTPAFSRKLSTDKTEYWVILNKDYFAMLDLDEQTLAHLSFGVDNNTENFWFEYNKRPELELNTNNLANNQKTGISREFAQDFEYWRTWVTDGDSKIDFMPEKIIFEPSLVGLSSSDKVRVKDFSGKTQVVVQKTRANKFWPFGVLLIGVILVYVKFRKKN